MKDFRKQKGSILIISFFIVLALLAEVLFVTTKTISIFQEGRLIDSSFNAWYLADSGVERILYQTRRLEDFTVPESMDLLGGQLRFAVKTEQAITVDIARNDFYQIDFFEIPVTQTITRINLQSDDPDGVGQLEVFATSWNPSAYAFQAPEPKVFGPYGSSALQSGVDVQLNLNSGFYHRVKLKALFDNVKKLTIKAYDAGGNQVDLPTRLIFSAQGFYGKSSQQLTVSMPKNPPVYGLFDYVLFSEESIEKQ